ncbi:DUF4382 domain-containing protein [Ferrimonas gelatinilytica]|uniref:DUF4382 domain-containing protein n=1 Tax=Ferrimonas gelatinilytica TaxID=1255257 RepID=A0ABP9SD85_9GAMM
MMKSVKSVLAASVVLALSGCGSDSSSPETGTFTLGVSDSPALATNVTIGFDRVVLKGEQTFVYDVTEEGELKQVNLLEFQGQQVEQLVAGQEVPVGPYQMCIYMKNDVTGSANTSFVIAEEVTKGLVSTSQGSCGVADTDFDAENVKEEGRIFLNKKFDIAVGNNAFVAEFNLAKLQGPKGNKDYWTLKPTDVVTIENVSDVGAIKGNVTAELFADCEIEAGGADVNNRGAVYLFPAGASVAGDEGTVSMADFRTTDGYLDTESAPFTAARVDEEGNYEMGFVVAGNYSLGYTCVAQNDDPDMNDMAEEGGFFFFADAADVTVNLEEVTEVNFAVQ